MQKISDLSIFSKIKPETLKWWFDSIKECPGCYDITERDKYEFLKKCTLCNRIRGYKCVVAPSLYLMEEDLEEDLEEMCLQEMSEELAQFREDPMEDVEKILPNLSFEEIEYLKWCLEDLEDVEEIPMFSDEEVEYLQWCFEVEDLIL